MRPAIATRCFSMSESLTLLREGETLLKQGRCEEAVETLRRAIDLDSGNAWPLHHLGDALGRLGRLADAVDAYQQALTLAPESPWTLENLGNTLSKLERWEEAEAAFRSAIDSGSTQPLTYLYLGEVLSRQGRCEEAVGAFLKSISLDARNAWPHHHLGDAFSRLGHLSYAVAAYEQALALSVDSVWTYRNLGSACLKLERWEQAEAACRSAIRLDPSEPYTFLHLGEALAKQERWEEAVEALRRSVALNSNNAWPYHHLGDTLGKLGRVDEAIAAYERALALSPDSVSTLQNLGTALAKMERWREAEACYLRARDAAGDDLHITAALGGVWLKLERWQEAASAYEQCLAVRPDDAELQRNLGIAVFKLETQKAYLRAHSDATPDSIKAEADTSPLPALDWTEARFGARVFEVERWIEGMLPTGNRPPGDRVQHRQRSADTARMLFILDNDFGELTTVMYLLLGQKWAEHVMVLLPDRLYAANSEAFPGRTFRYQSIGDVEEVVKSFCPDIAFLCSGYLYAMHGLLSHEQLQQLVDLLTDRGCGVVTADPFLGVLSQQSVCSLISIDVPDASDLELPAHVFAHLESVKAEQDEWIVEKLSGAERILSSHLHLYPAHASGVEAENLVHNARERAFFNPELVCDLALQADPATRPHWIFILSATDLDTQLMFEAVRGFGEIVARLLTQAIALGRRPIFVGPEKFIRDLAREMRGQEGAELLSFCSFSRLASLLLTAEHAFYWNSVSHTILLRSFNGLPVVLFDRGHLVRNVEAIYDRVVQWYYQGVQPIYLDHSEPLTLEVLDAATAEFRGNADSMRRGFQRAPDPRSLIEQIIDRSGPAAKPYDALVS